MAMRMVAPLEVGICCLDLDRLAEFYIEVLGCEAISTIEVPAAKAREAALSSDSYRVIRLETPRGERIKLRMVQPRDRVRVTYTEFADPMVARAIEVLPGHPAASLPQ